MSIKPIKPSDIVASKKSATPPAVIAIFNEEITKHFSNGRAVVKQSDVMNEIEHRVEGPDRNDMRAAWLQNVVLPWLNVEEIYRAVGWDVVYDKPEPGETGSATFTFTPHTAPEYRL